MDSVYTMLDGIDAVFQFRNHSAADSTIGDQVLSLIYTKFGDQSGRIGSVSVYTFNIGKEGKFLCIDRLCNSAGCIICVNVVGIKILVKTDWEYDRKEVSFQKVLEDLWIDFCDFTYVADVLAFGKFLFALEKTTVFTADTYSLNAERFYSVTSSLFTLARTISAISMVSLSVTRRPFTKRGSMPTLPTQRLISLPPP